MGKPLTDEHKKKISEALKKLYGSKEETGRSEEAQKYLETFTGMRVSYDEAKAERERLQAKSKALGRTKATKTARASLQKQIKELTKEMKTLRTSMMEVKNESNNKRLQKNATANIQKAELKVSQYTKLMKTILDLIHQTKDQGRRDRLKARLDRAIEMKGKQEAKIGELKGVASGKTTAKRSTAFNFTELAENFKPFRTLTLQEQRIDFSRLNEQLDEQARQFEDEMIEITNEEINRVTRKIEDEGTVIRDTALIPALLLLIRGAVKSTTRKAIGTFYGIGTGLALRELKLAGYDTGSGRPPVPMLDKQIISTDSELISETYVQNVENVARSILQAGIVAGATAQGIASVMRDEMKAEASKAITNISGTITGEYMNRGRTSIFNKQRSNIVAFQRSEVLDARTCAICLSMDKRVVKADDPMAQMEIVHTSCRGLWNPIFERDEEKPDITGIPTSITSRFKTIEGVPIINSYKQIKKPVNEVSKEAQRQIDARF